jgi:creatinine amidohydrolase
VEKRIAYEEMTWLQVAALPRDIPMVLPLGSGFRFDELAATFGNPSQIALLPSFPFGWHGSGLVVEPALLSNYVKNLLQSLRDDGFIKVFVLTPQGIDLGLGDQQIVSKVSGRINPPPFFPEDNTRNKVVLIPIGHTEQHSHHLPLDTDTVIIEAISRGVVQEIPTQAVTLPVMPYGVSTHRAAFAGTLNAGGRAFEDFWLGVVDTLVQRGFTRFYFMSGHGGNSSFLTNIVKYAGERYYQTFIATAWLYLSGPEGIASLEKHRQSTIGGMGHACELETSLILHLRPDLVHMDRVIDDIDFISTPSYYMDWVEGGALIANPPWEDDVKAGAYGAGSLGTAEKGAIWLQAAIREKVGHVGEIHEQYTRRISKRKLWFG